MVGDVIPVRQGVRVADFVHGVIAIALTGAARALERAAKKVNNGPVDAGGRMGDKDSGTEERAASLSEARAGLKLQTGRRVVLTIRDLGIAGGRKTIQGIFYVGGHVMQAATFLLHKDSAGGPLVTPDTLAGGSTTLSWSGDHWVSGDDGTYAFADLADGNYFIELFSKEPPAEDEP